MAWDPLTPEQREIRDLVRMVARERIAPRAAEIDASHEFPWDVVELFRENRRVRAVVLRGGRRHGDRHTALARGDRGGLAGLCDERADPGGAGARLARPQARGLGRAARGLVAATGVRRGARRICADRVGVGLGLGRDADDGAPRRRWMGAGREQAVHHQRRGRRCLHRLREDRSRRRSCGDLGVRRRGRTRRLRGGASRGEDGDPGSTTGELVFDGCRVPGGEPARRGGRGIPDRDADPRPLAPGRRRRRRSASRRAQPTTRSSTHARARRWGSRSPSTS